MNKPFPAWRIRTSSEVPASCRVGWAVWYSDGEWAWYADEQQARDSAYYWQIGRNGDSVVFHNGEVA